MGLAEDDEAFLVGAILGQNVFILAHLVVIQDFVEGDDGVIPQSLALI